MFVSVDQRDVWVVIHLAGGVVGVSPLFIFFFQINNLFSSS